VSFYKLTVLEVRHSAGYRFAGYAYALSDLAVGECAVNLHTALCPLSLGTPFEQEPGQPFVRGQPEADHAQMFAHLLVLETQLA
jgi:hypothetical protein